MRICFLFRGENERFSRGYMNSCNNINNWNRTLFQDVLSKGHTYEITFITYPSNVLELLCSLIRPNHLVINQSISQTQNCKDIAKWILEHKDEYDRFIILRFDILYKLPITEWNHWTSNGITLLNKDVCWLDERLCSDLVFICDQEMIEPFSKALIYTRRQAHQVSQYLCINDIPFNLMFDDFYHIYNHPYYAIAMLNPEPNLDVPFQMTLPDPVDFVERSVTYKKLIQMGLDSTDHCCIVVNDEASVQTKIPEISYLYSVFTWISFKSKYIDEVKKIHTKKRFLYHTDIKPTFTLEIEGFNLTEQEKSDFTPRDS